MPLKQFCCSICGRCCPKEYLKHGKMAKRMGWLRNHYRQHHPVKFHVRVRKGVTTRARRRSK